MCDRPPSRVGMNKIGAMIRNLYSKIADVVKTLYLRNVRLRRFKTTLISLV